MSFALAGTKFPDNEEPSESVIALKSPFSREAFVYVEVPMSLQGHTSRQSTMTAIGIIYTEKTNDFCFVFIQTNPFDQPEPVIFFIIILYFPGSVNSDSDADFRGQ